MKELRKTTENLRQNNSFPGKNLGPYENGVPTAVPRYWDYGNCMIILKLKDLNWETCVRIRSKGRLWYGRCSSTNNSRTHLLISLFPDSESCLCPSQAFCDYHHLGNLHIVPQGAQREIYVPVNVASGEGLKHSTHFSAVSTGRTVSGANVAVWMDTSKAVPNITAVCTGVRTGIAAATRLRPDSHYASRFRSVTVPSLSRQNDLCPHCPSCSFTFNNSTW